MKIQKKTSRIIIVAATALILVVIGIGILIFLKPKISTDNFQDNQAEENENDAEIMMNPMNIQLVISRYNEDLAWIKEEPFNRYPNIIYNKGVNSDFETNDKTLRVKSLNNVGRCDETYLNHVVHQYNHLAPITVFLPGSLNIQYKSDKAKRLIQEIEDHGDTVFIGKQINGGIQELYDFSLDTWQASDEKNRSINDESKLEPAFVRPFGKWYEIHFPDKNPDLYFYSYNGIIAISRRDIQGHPPSHYKKFLKQLQNASNPEAGHYVERSWVSIFHPYKNAKFLPDVLMQ